MTRETRVELRAWAGVVLLGGALGCGLGACASHAAEVRPVRLANQAAADALGVVETLELAHLKQTAMAKMDACPADANERACRRAAVASVADAERSRVAVISQEVKTQRAVADAIVTYDACSKQGGDIEACEARLSLEVQGMAPALVQLLSELRQKGQAP